MTNLDAFDEVLWALCGGDSWRTNYDFISTPMRRTEETRYARILDDFLEAVAVADVCAMFGIEAHWGRYAGDPGVFITEEEGEIEGPTMEERIQGLIARGLL